MTTSDRNSLDKGVALAASSHRVSVKIYKLEFAKWLKDLLNIRLGEIEVKRSDVKSKIGVRNLDSEKFAENHILHSAALSADTWRKIKISACSS